MNFPKQPAIAPYNFVELPDRVVSAQLECDGKLRDNDRYYPGRHTGRIECTLTTSSPLYIRCGLTKEQFCEGKQAKDIPEFYYIDTNTKNPVLPGSSLRGMLRDLVEIVSFSKITKVSDKQLVYRAVGDTSSLGEIYRDKFLLEIGNRIYRFKMKAGYLVNSNSTNNNNWKIYPALPLINGVSFARIETRAIQAIYKDLPQWHGCRNARQIAVNINPTDRHPHSRGRIQLEYAKATPITNQRKNQYNGVLVKTGQAPRKKMEFVFGFPDKNHAIDVSEKLIEEYKSQITDGQIGILGENGALNHWQPIFYIMEDNQLVFFGHAMMFRIPYDDSINQFIPNEISELKNPEHIDIADAIFGWVRQNNNKENQRSGKISISDAKYKEDKNGIWHAGNPEDSVTPQILASPKPTTFQHYLVQPKETKAKKEDLKHYASQPVTETVIRGHKLYWHKPENHKFEHPAPNQASETQLTKIKPIAKDVTFTFTIHFENLTSVELGALLWVLDIAKDDHYRLKLGMGKPLGLGSIKIESELYLSDRKKRYTQLFEGQQWKTSERLEDDPDYQQVFENYILEQLEQTGKFKDICRIQMLLAMLCWPGPKDTETRYMKITPVNEYKERLVLPTPLQVIGIEVQDCLRSSPADSTAPVISLQSSSERPRPKPDPPKR
jgi:CRISPR-associated protein (TIGR03986 family)